MRIDLLKKIFRFTIIYFLFFTLISCGTTGGGIRFEWGKESKQKNPSVTKKGPPSHAKAHGYRAKYRYWYYPSYSIYFDIDRKLYFYIQDNDWKITKSLPIGVSGKLKTYVVIDLDTDKPYHHHKEHKKKFPPGKLKKHKK